MPNQPQAHITYAQNATKSIAIKLLGVACAFGTLLPSIAQAPADVRIALVIGNAAYPGTAALANPGNDAKAMGETLRGLGFTVVEARDASRAQIVQAIATVRDNLKGRQGVGMLYYAGHGLQLDWRNYMVPVDAKMSKAADVPEQAVDLGQVIEAFKAAGNRMNIVVLDACRDNPFAGTATGKGLAQLDAPPGTFLAYATAPGNVAEDGEVKAADGKESNGLYTKYLLQELKKPQAKIEDVFKRVRLNVRQQSQGRQIPWESTSLEVDFYFDKDGSANTGVGVGSAAHKLQASLWDTLKNSSDSAAIIEFLKIFPSGYFSELAQTRLDQISAPQVAVVNRPDNISAKVGQLRKPVIGDVKEFEQSVRDGSSFTKFVQRSEVVRISEDRVFYKEKFSSLGKPTDVLSEVDLQGNLIKSADIEFKDPTQFVPAEYRVGYKWRFGVRSYSQVTGEVFRDYEAKIVKLESITTKLGEFNAFRIELKMRRSDGVTEESIRWVDPSYAGGIKSQRRLYNRGSLIYSHDSETISFTPGNKV